MSILRHAPLVALAAFPLLARGEAPVFSDAERGYWAFRPVPESVAVPELAPGTRGANPIDAFIAEKLAAGGLAQSPQASPRTLVRRLAFDLLGVPPTPEEVEAFVADPGPDAYERLVDRFLADPRYGKRWARHWLDVVRHADSDGYRADAFRPEAWRYRDYVIDAFNADKSYRDFVREQLAGDEIAPESLDALVATGFYRGGVYEYNNRDAEGQWALILNEVTDTVGDVFLGLGFACARCHDHKFDPIPQRDYYRLQAFFRPLLWRDDVPLAGPDEQAAHAEALAAWRAENAETLGQIEAMEEASYGRAEQFMVEKFPDNVQAMYRKPPAERGAYEHQMAYIVTRQITEEGGGRTGKLGDDSKAWAELKKRIKPAEDSMPKPLPRGMTVADAPGSVPLTTLPGDPSGEDIAPGFLSILDADSAALDPALARAPGSSGRRAALAEWIASPENPLSTRVIVNRIWQYHFGTGLVANASDFGTLGDPPSHPELLDWLTRDFLANGWHFKPLHKRIVMSETYRQASTTEASEAARMADPQNRLLWRFPARRLEAEQIRDALLVASGEMKDKSGGPPASANDPYRSIYTKVLRNAPDPLLESFDAPLAFASEAQRNATTTPTQSLLMINGAWTLQRAGAMAKSLLDQAEGDLARAVERAYPLAYGRAPTSEERANALAFLDAQAQRTGISPEATVAEVPDETFLDTPELRRWETAFNTRDDAGVNRLRLSPDSADLPDADFTIEAIVYLRSLYPDGRVRTLAARWNGEPNTRGWSFGVTSEKSAHLPRNLILQFAGDARDGAENLRYEVVPSGLRIPSDKATYVAASVDFANGKATFHTRDMSNPEALMETAEVPFTVGGRHFDPGQALTLGAREGGSAPHNWDGLIDEVRLTRGAITSPDHLLANLPGDAVTPETLGYWRFVRADEGGLMRDFSPHGNTLAPGYNGERESVSPSLLALTDFCHALLNSNEFLYAD